ncbi:alpha/beta fold hydrolase [Archangium violaceum]|uniref:alpha/beta fold hydrolase n=1 Tax=Archangium violaceum TaxID=83451 RepID=UPI0019502F35|nr:alpha/beta hydrolase [Archangium violaceum]QRO02118.1 alpha/beta fold hydrolase [Archangium violaceum]
MNSMRMGSWILGVLAAVLFLGAAPATAQVPTRDVWVEQEGLSFHGVYWNHGKKKTIIYIPGYGDPGTTGDSIFHRDLFADYAVLSIDPLNQGQSDHAIRADLVDLMNKVILAFMNQEGIHNAYLAGHSAGALQALAFEQAHPTRALNKVVLLDDGQISLGQVPPIQFLPDNVFGLPAGPYSVLQIEALFFDPSSSSMTYDEYITGLTAYTQFDVTETWPAVKKALLLTRDFSLPTIPPSLGVDASAADSAFQQAAMAFACNVKHARWIELAGATHNMWREPASSDAAAAHIARFLRP